LSQRKDGGVLAAQDGRKTGTDPMNDAQIGLAVSTPIIVLFSVALCRMGVLQRYSAVAAVIASVAIAAVLFTQP